MTEPDRLPGLRRVTDADADDLIALVGAAYDEHPDTGCIVSRHCLTCPLPLCKYDDPLWRTRHRANQVAQAYHEGLTRNQTATRLHLSERTVYRALAQMKLAQRKAKV
jgi:AraC-like DNA-binding protein